MPSRRASEPRLTANNQDFKCGYGPRSIRLSHDRKTVFVGCKDGSVIKVDLNPAARQGESSAVTELCPPGTTCIRSLCDLDNRWLLLGQDDGQLSVLRWDRPNERCEAKVKLPPDGGGVGYVGRWAPNLFLVSPRHSDAVFLKLQPTAKGGFVLAEAGRLAGVLAICGFARTGPDERWIICKDGSLWRCRGAGKPKPLQYLWKQAGFERPGYVYDVAVVRRDPEEGDDLGVYFSTDEGVFLLRRTAPGTTSLCLEPISLPGITDTCLAITHAVQKKRCFLWVSDVEGRVHLFWSDAGDSLLAERPLWRRSGLLEGRFPVRRALASWSPREGHEAVVCQACRDDRIVISWYRLKAPGKSHKEQDAAETLSWGTIAGLPFGEGMESWCEEARLADHIEVTGQDPEQLRRFLRNPGIGLAFSTLERILAGGADSRRRAAEALTLWTHTLIGTIHRRLKPPATQDYLGIIRWLRRLGEKLTEDPQGETLDEVLGGIEDNILYARRWGVFGGTYGTRKYVLNALLPLSTPPGREGNTPEREMDRVVYESLIFRRRTDLEEVLPEPFAYDLAPWELQYLAASEGEGLVEYVAMSWVDGGTVYRRPAGATDWTDLTGDKEKNPTKVSKLGRRLLLGTCGPGSDGKPFLLSAPQLGEPPSPSPGATGQAALEEAIELHFIDDDRLDARFPPLPVSKLFNERERRKDKDVDSKVESVYGFLDLDFGQVAIGLKGISGEARIGVLAVTPEGGLRALRQTNRVSFPSVYPESKTVLGNPVWALHLYARTREEAILFIGCSDGQIWKVRLSFQGEDEFEIKPPIKVGRLGAPVSALACRTVGDRAEGPVRVFAGGADGTIVAYQALGDGQHHRETYATLWVTLEEGPVQRILTFESDLVIDTKKPEGEGFDCEQRAFARHLVLAITRAGRAILFMDRLQMEQRDPTSQDPQRLKVPGERLGRFALDSTAFGAALLPPRPGEKESAGPVLARLMVMPASGGPRIYTLHYPKYTPLRQDKFHELESDWLALLKGADGEVRRHLLRQPETTYAAAPGLPAILVRWILPYGPNEKPWEIRVPQDDLGPGLQWLPRHLRPLVLLDRNWKSEISLRGMLKEALLRAREIGDKDLFQEILEATLSRANHELYARATGKGGVAFDSKFVDLLADIEEVKGAFEGKPANLDVRMRITIMKGLLDGDTLWALSQAQAALSAQGTMAQEEKVTEAMRARILLIHRSLGKGDLLLALETLRAANLALLRLCRRLERKPEEDWKEEDPKRELRWQALQGFFQAVGDFAARVAHPKGNLGEVAAHEICRSYALGMLACPSGIVRLAIWVAEADLPIDIGQRVEQQLDLLQALLGDFPPLSPKHRKLLRTALRTFRGGDYKQALFFPSQQARISLTDSQVGRDNLEMIHGRRPFDQSVVWLHELAHQLADDAGKVDIQRYSELLLVIRKLDGTRREQFRHSRDFWRRALTKLGRLRRKFKDLFAAPREDDSGNGVGKSFLQPVRPELVLFSNTLVDWCKEQRDEISRLRLAYRLFDPVSSLFDEAFALVEKAAQRFQQGAAVQKNLVLGVLGHGLLELLDEHLLEVWEVAQALDPRRAWEQDEKAGEGNFGYRLPMRTANSTAARFADYLLERALKAEVIPKNLRSLQGLLSFTEEAEAPALTLRRLIGEIGWALDNLSVHADVALGSRTYHFLRLTLSELAQNDRMHGEPAISGGARRAPKIWDGESPKTLWLEFSYPLKEEATKRVEALTTLRLQEMMGPSDDPRIPSHGTGLYLANLAAGAVGWKLEIFPDFRVLMASEENGLLTFRLKKVESPKRAGSE